MRFQTILIAQTSLLGSILYYLFARDLGGGRLSNDTQLGAIGCFFGVFVAYFLFKYLVYGFVNWVFFDRKIMAMEANTGVSFPLWKESYYSR